MTSKWLDAETYVVSNLESPDVEMLNAQAADAEQRCYGISSVDLTTSWHGVAPRVTMVLNRGWQSEMTIELSPAQIACMVPWLIFEGREAVQRATNKQLTQQDVARWQLHRCPECGLGPYGPYVRVASCLQEIAAAKTMDEMYAAYDERIPPVFDHIPQPARRLVIDALDARRPEFHKRSSSSDKGS